jgi:oligoendopeptidase F
MSTVVPERSQIAIEHTWNRESVYATSADWEAEFEAVGNRLPELARFRGHLADGPQMLTDWLAASEALMRRYRKLWIYASMSQSVDTKDAEAADRFGRIGAFGGVLRAAMAFAEPEILAIPSPTLREWIAQEPALRAAAHYFDRLERRRPHVRSAEVEALLGQVSVALAGPRQTHGALANTDLTFDPARDEVGTEYDVTQGSIRALLSHPDRQVRAAAYAHYADSFLATRHTAAACLEAGIQGNVFQARARNYPSALHAALESGFIPVEVFHNLLAVFQANLPVWHRYWDLRRRALGLERLPVHDIHAPLTADPPGVPLAQAVEWIGQGMQPLGEEYVTILLRGVREERWVDVYPNQGKRMGAFSSGSPDTYPFILMSYNDDLNGLSTLAHELGHSLHSYLTCRTQPYLYTGYGLFAAEVASNFNQALVRAHLLRTQNDHNFQIAVLEEAMTNFHRYLFVMPTLARFELEIHTRVERGEALTAKSLTALMTDLFAEAYGPAVALETPAERDRVGITWAQFPTHLYSNFYVYQYATGIAGAHALAHRVQLLGQDAAEDYLNFLRAGGSDYPLNLLRAAGVDLASPEPVERMFTIFSEYVDRLEHLLAV